MDTWEFLLQKKGDKSWLPLEAPTVEILEGQYRLAARSTFADALINIQLRYTPHPETNYRPNQQKISKRANPEGLLIVMPYTHLTPGNWQINCSQDKKLVEPKSAPWSVNLQFDVLPISSDLSMDWQMPDLPELGAESSESSETNPETDFTDASNLFQPEPITQLVSSQLHKTQLETQWKSNDIEDLDELIDTDNAEIDHSATDETIPTELPQQLLRLDQAQYLAAKGKTIVVSGEAYIIGDLEITLKNPQNLEILFKTLQPLKLPQPLTIPFRFACEIALPDRWKSQVSIGEVRLLNSEHSALELSEDYITHQVITVTYQSDNLLAEIEQELIDRELEEFSTPVLSTPTVTSLEPQPQVNQIVNPDDLITQISESTARSVAPPPILPALPKLPQLPFKPYLPRKPVVKKTISKPVTEPTSSANSPILPPKLPSLSSLNPQAIIDSDPDTDWQSGLNLLDELIDRDREIPSVPNAETLQSLAISEVDLDAELSLEMPLLKDIDVIKEPELRYEFEDDIPYEFETANQKLDLTSHLELTPPEKPDAVLQPLKLGDRFLQKLQTLSLENIVETTEDIPETPITSIAPTEVSLPTSPKQELEVLALELEQMLIQDETLSQIEALCDTPELDFKLDDLDNDELDNIEANISTELAIQSNEQAVQVEIEQVNTDLVPNSESPDRLIAIDEVEVKSNQAVTAPALVQPTIATQEPVPLPIIEIPDGELSSGSSIPISIRLPAIAPKLAVKLWVKDCQTRALVDGPRWLMDFKIVAGSDFVETVTQITVPLSSIEVAFEAITVEMQTQRESYKNRIIRTVNPPNLSQTIEINFDNPWDL